MARRLAAFIIATTIMTPLSSAHAQTFAWFHEFCHSVATDFQRNNCYPEPFPGPDRAAVRVPFNIMVHNGWRIQNTLTEHYFDETTGELTQAGQNKVYWILNQAPQQHRTIFVQKTRSEAVTSQRLELVQSLASAYAPEGTLPSVELSNDAIVGWPAERVDQISRAFDSSAPDPRLPVINTSTGGGAGMSGGL